MTEEQIRLIISGRNDLDRPLTAARRGVATFADGTIGHFRRVARHVLNLQNVVIGAGAAMAAKSLFAPAIETETFRTQYENLLGSAEDARDRVEALMNFSDVTPFEPEPVVKAALVLDRFTRGAEDTIDMVRLVGDAAAATGSEFGELGGWIGRAYAMIKGGEPIGEATRRLLELGVITPDVKAKIADLQEENKSAAEVWAVLRTALEEHEGAMEKLSRTTGGRLSTLAGKWSALRRDVADSAVPELNAAIDELIGTIDEMRDSGNLQVLGDRVGGAIRTIHDTAKSLVTFVDKHRETLATLGLTYAGLRILRSLTAAVSTTAAGMRVLAVSTVASTVATEAHAAATTHAAASASALAGTMTMVKTAMLGLAGLGIQAGIAFIAAELYGMHRAARKAAQALDELEKTGGRVSGSYETYARRFNGFRQKMQDLKEGLFGESEGQKLELGPADLQGGWEEKYRDVLDRLERMRRDAVEAAKSGGGDDVEMWRRVTGLDSLEKLDMSALTDEESELSRLLARFESLSGEKDAELGLRIAVRTARKRMRPEQDDAEEREDPDDLKQAEALRKKIAGKEQDLAEERERATAERAYRDAEAEKRAGRTTAEAHLAALDDYLEAAESARNELEQAEDLRSEEAARAKMDRAKREARAEAKAARVRIAALREYAGQLETAAAEARRKADDALWALLNPEQAAKRARAEADKAEKVSKLRTKAEGLRERFTGRDEEGRWVDRWGRRASTRSQDILDWADLEDESGRKAKEAKETDDRVREAEAKLADSQEALREATITLADNTNELKAEIAAMRQQLAAMDSQDADKDGNENDPGENGTPTDREPGPGARPAMNEAVPSERREEPFLPSPPTRDAMNEAVAALLGGLDMPEVQSPQQPAGLADGAAGEIVSELRAIRTWLAKASLGIS